MPRSLTSMSRQIVRNFGTCLKFNGTSSLVSLGTGSGLITSVFTYTAWIKQSNVTKASASYAIIGDSDADDGIEFRVDNSTGKLELLKQGRVSIGKSNGIIPSGVWTHVAVSYDGSGNYIFYINGVASGTGTSAQSFISSTVQIGKANTATPEYFNGFIDEVKFYTSVLSSTQISNIFYGVNNSNTDTNLTGYYRFDEGSGTAAIDSSNTQPNGTITSATYSTDVILVSRTVSGTRSQASATGYALSFNGGTNIVSIPLKSPQTSLTTVSYALWYYRAGAGGSSFGCALVKKSGTTNRFALYNNNSVAGTMAIGVNFAGGDNSWRFNRGTDNTWHHVVVTWDVSDAANIPHVYLDGVEVTITQFAGPSSGAVISDDSNLYIGCRSDLSLGWNGRIDDVREYNRILTAQEAAALYSGYSVQNGLVAWWPLDENGGTAVNDMTNNKATGSISGATYVAGIQRMVRRGAD